MSCFVCAAAELKVFLGTMEQMKKKAEMVKALTEEKEDLTSNLRVSVICLSD